MNPQGTCTAPELTSGPIALVLRGAGVTMHHPKYLDRVAGGPQDQKVRK